MRLELNNSGSWKVVLHDVDPEHVEAVRAAVLELLACDRAGSRTRWILSEADAVHPGGKTVAQTVGTGRDAKWQEVGW